MGIYLYWGEDDFAMARAVGALREQILDPAWAAFNFDKITCSIFDSNILPLSLSLSTD